MSLCQRGSPPLFRLPRDGSQRYAERAPYAAPLTPAANRAIAVVARLDVPSASAPHRGIARRQAPISSDRAVPEPQITTLPGGERVATEPLRGVRSVALGLWIGDGLARRAAVAGGRLALHRAPALQGLVALQRAGHRRALRRDGRRAQRGDLARDDRRLHARARPPRRGGARRDGRHGLRARLRRRRLRARGRARGDRDGGRQPAGPRPRPRRRGRLRRRTRSAGR